MCGICGGVNISATEPLHEATIAAMCDSITHRGPDASGIYINDSHQVGLGSRRLSIIDIAGGDQPIHNEDKTIWIVFNGEIYNYPDLTELLTRRGHTFYTSTDTEAIVHAYEEFGDDFLKYLNGMFAFAIWDERQQRLLIARDRMGIKPLYYTRQGNRFIFGSELKAILAHPGVERQLDLVSLDKYLTFEYVPTPSTIFQGISKLPPGHALEVKGGQVNCWEYWDINLQRSENVQHESEQYYVETLLDVLRESIQRELISDVPVGVLLSGGIDSSAVAALACETIPQINTFSISFDDPTFDESKYAWMVAEHLGTNHRELRLTPGIVTDLLPEIAGHMDEPIGDSSIVPTYFLSRFVRQHVKVALGGDGGDEIFGGYSTLQAHRLVEYYEALLPGFVRLGIIPYLASKLPPSFDNISLDFKIKRFISGRGVPPIVRHNQWLGSFTPEQKQQLLKPWAQTREHDTFDILFEHLHASRVKENMNALLYSDIKMYMEGDILPKVDRMSMAASLEVRVPLLNHRLVEYAATIPHEFKLKGLTTKYILREAMRNHLPKAVLDRGKKGFNMPVARWLLGPLQPLTQDLLSQDYLRQQGIFEPTYVQHLIAEHMNQQVDRRKLVWTLLAFQLWYQEWMS